MVPQIRKDIFRVFVHLNLSCLRGYGQPSAFFASMIKIDNHVLMINYLQPIVKAFLLEVFIVTTFSKMWPPSLLLYKTLVLDEFQMLSSSFCVLLAMEFSHQIECEVCPVAIARGTN